MKSMLKSMGKILTIVFLLLYLGVAVFVTVCLLNFNDSRVTQFGDTSLIIVDEELSTDYKKGDLVVVKRDDGSLVNEGDSIFFYDPSLNDAVNYAEVNGIEYNGNYYTYTIGDNYTVYYDYYIGTHGKSFRYVGSVLSVLESKWGFLLLVILPVMVAVIFEIYAIIIEIVELKKED